VDARLQTAEDVAAMITSAIRLKRDSFISAANPASTPGSMP
jgi:hypothetical protein